VKKLSPYAKEFLARCPNPSPPLPGNTTILEELVFWPEDDEEHLFLRGDHNLRFVFTTIHEKWPDACLEHFLIGTDLYYVTLDHLEEFLVVEKI
jgi:hypothetical protein